MASTKLYYANQYFTTTLSVVGGINDSQTTGIVLSGVSGLDISKPGIALIGYASPLDTSAAEWITYTSINGSNELQGVTRGTEGFSAKAFSNGAAIAFPVSESHINNLNAMFNTTGVDIAQISTPASPDSGRNKIYFKSDGELYKLNSSGTETSLSTGGSDGWTTASGTWTYASASTITVPSGAASIYQRGDKIKFTQTTVKYAVIVTVADTLLTIAVNNDYTVANAAITSPAYSHVSNPLGFPASFNYTPTYTFTAGAAPSGAVSNANAEYTVNGGILTVRSSKIYAVAGTTVTRCDISLPFTVNSSVDQTVVGGGCFSNGTAPITTYIQITTTTAQLFCGSSTVDRLGFFATLEI